MEDNQDNGSIPFLDTLATPLADKSLSFKVYQKPTHIDQYLQWESHHSLSAKYSVIGTLTHRAKVVCNDPDLLQSEIDHLRSALGRCNYPKWEISKVQNKVLNNNQEGKDPEINPSNSDNNNGQDTTTQTRDNNNSNQNSNFRVNRHTVGQVVIPYTKEIGKSIKQVCGKYGIQVHFRGNSTIKQALMKPRDQNPRDSKSGVIYSYQCNHLDCNEEYIGKTSRTLGERRKEHLRQPSPIHGHI